MNSKQRRTFKRKRGIKQKNYIFSSCGNDSVALMQYCVEHFPNDENVVVYSDTGWAAVFWQARVDKVKAYAEKNNIKFVVTNSEGMEALVRRKKGWPMAASKMQFCTDALKIQPAIKYMNDNDDFGMPHFRTRCLTGIRREESKNRETAPAYIKHSEKHGSRPLTCPLIEFKEEKRNELINKTGIEVLPHSSMECFPCVCANRKDFRMLANYPEKINKIAVIEQEMGFTSKGKPRVMFRPYRHMGATGIRDVVKWGLAERGKYGKEDKLSCNSGFCGF